MSAASPSRSHVLSVQQAAEILQVSRATVRRAAMSGGLAHWATPGGHLRFRLEDVIDYGKREMGLQPVRP